MIEQLNKLIDEAIILEVEIPTEDEQLDDVELPTELWYLLDNLDNRH